MAAAAKRRSTGRPPAVDSGNRRPDSADRLAPLRRGDRGFRAASAVSEEGAAEDRSVRDRRRHVTSLARTVELATRWRRVCVDGRRNIRLQRSSLWRPASRRMTSEAQHDGESEPCGVWISGVVNRVGYG